MRLTLRTLLAYMDDILDPADQEELGRKIESSAFATELIHRSRDTVRRLRLSAPDVLAGSGGGVHDSDQSLDANTSAEYLDSLLSPEEVAEFERSCLEAGSSADMQLAEVVSCHHILTMVLGEPAEVDSDLRQRMYALLEKHGGQQLRIEPAHRTSGQARAAPAAMPAVASFGAPRVDPDEAAAPDFMLAAARAERRSRRRMVGALAVAAILGGVAAWVFWPGKEVDVPGDVAKMGNVDDISKDGVEVGDVQGSGATASTADATGESTAGEDAPPFTGAADTVAPAFIPSTGESPSAETAETETPEDGATATATVDAPPTDAPPAIGPATPPTIPAEALAADQTAAAAAADAATPPAAPAELPNGDESTAAPATATTPDSPIPPPLDPATAAADAAALTPAPPVELAAASGDAVMAAAATADIPNGGFTAEGAAEGSPDAAAPRPVGAYLGNNDILLRYDAASEAWVRLPPRSALAAGDRLLSLPTFRTHVVLADVNAYLAGGAELAVTGAASDGELALATPHGQFIFNAGLNGNRLALAMGDQTRIVNLGPSSSLAIEVRRVFVPGAVLGQEPAPTVIRWYLTSGKADWTGGAPVGASAEGPAMWVTADSADGAAETIKDLPKWVDEQSTTANERRAQEAVAGALAAGEPVNTALLELTDETGRGRLTEVRALAAESSAYVGQFDPLVKALSDVGQRASWEKQITTLRDSIARDPAAAEAVRDAFAAQRGEKAAADLMEMLLGFDAAAVGVTREEVQQGVLVRLIRWMNDEDLTYRILSSYVVNEILGTNYLGGYRPQHTAAQRKRELRHYWDRLERGELMPKVAGSESE